MPRCETRCRCAIGLCGLDCPCQLHCLCKTGSPTEIYNGPCGCGHCDKSCAACNRTSEEFRRKTMLGRVRGGIVLASIFAGTTFVVIRRRMNRAQVTTTSIFSNTNSYSIGCLSRSSKEIFRSRRYRRVQRNRWCGLLRPRCFCRSAWRAERKHCRPSHLPYTHFHLGLV